MKRASNIELCRILCMFFIICHHCVESAGIFLDPCKNWILANFMLPGGKICYNAFVAITMWFLVDQQFKSKRFLKIWAEMLFYNLATMIVASILFGAVYSKLDIVSAFLQVGGAGHHYAQTYLAFYLLLPLIGCAGDNMKKELNLFLIAVLSIFVIEYRVMATLIYSEQSVYCRLILWIYIYYVIRYIKKYPIKICENKWACMAVFCLCWYGKYKYEIVSYMHPEYMCWPYLDKLFYDEGGLVLILGGMSMFLFFKNVNMKSYNLINQIASVTLGVLLIHDGHFFREYTWQLAKVGEWVLSNHYLLRVCLVSAIIYMICMVVDLIRRYMLEIPLFKIKVIDEICKKIDEAVC